MAADNAHIIQRQVFELSTAKLQANLGFQDNSPNLLHKVINPAIESCFNNWVKDDQHLVIDKLEIDLGSFTPENIEKEAALRLKEILGSLLSAYHNAASRENGIHHIQHEHGFISSQNNGQEIQHSGKTQILDNVPGLLSNAQSLHQGLIYFLATGRLPWWRAADSSNSAWNEANTLDACFSYEWMGLLAESEKSRLREALTMLPEARTRLANHFSGAWMGELLQELGLHGAEGFRQWKIFATALDAFPLLGRRLHQFFWVLWIESALAGREQIDPVLLVELTTGGEDKPGVSLATELLEQCRQQSSETTFFAYSKTLQKFISAGNKPVLRGIYDRTELRKSVDSVVDTENTDVSKPPGITKQARENILNAAKTEDSDPVTGGRKNKTLAEDDAVFVEAAGIVILHPFFAELFKETGLWDGEKWMAEDSNHRAVQLLAWLGFGETGLPEYRVTLLKILMGLDIDDALPAIPPLTQPEINACTELLQAVVQHWKALRSTSTDGLQQGFLQRDGKLTETAKGYQLAVERKAQDVLLAQLPWGYSMISLPWMEKIMNITWI